jgi:hypothetical protein
MWPGIFLWWLVWPMLLTSLASKGLFKTENLPPSGSHLMSEGGLSSKCPGVEPFRMAVTLSSRASTPARGISCSACYSLHLPTDGLSYSGSAGALSPHLRMPSFGASHSGIPSTPKHSHGGNSSGVLSLRCATPSALGSNTLGSVVAAFLAMPMSLTLAVPLVGAGVVSTSNDTPPGSCASMTAHSMAFAPAFLAAWPGPRPTPPASAGGSSHKWGGIKASRWHSAAHCTGAAPSPGTMLHTQVLSDSKKGKW